MKINNITLQERVLWIVGAGLVAFYAENQMKKTDDLHTLLTTYHLEANIQDAQIGDFSQQLNSAKDSAYSRGFEDGKTQAGVAFMNGDSLYDYTEGYHQAISQFYEARSSLTEDEALNQLINIITKDDIKNDE